MATFFTGALIGAVGCVIVQQWYMDSGIAGFFIGGATVFLVEVAAIVFKEEPRR